MLQKSKRSQVPQQIQSISIMQEQMCRDCEEDEGLDRSRSAIDYYLNLMSTSLRGYIELSASMSNGKPTIYYGVGNKYKIKIVFTP